MSYRRLLNLLFLKISRILPSPSLIRQVVHEREIFILRSNLENIFRRFSRSRTASGREEGKAESQSPALVLFPRVSGGLVLDLPDFQANGTLGGMEKEHERRFVFEETVDNTLAPLPFGAISRNVFQISDKK